MYIVKVMSYMFDPFFRQTKRKSFSLGNDQAKKQRKRGKEKEPESLVIFHLDVMHLNSTWEGVLSLVRFLKLLEFDWVQFSSQGSLYLCPVLYKISPHLFKLKLLENIMFVCLPNLALNSQESCFQFYLAEDKGQNNLVCNT